MRALASALIALSLVSACTGATPSPTQPTGSAKEVTQTVAALMAPGADIDDRPFEDAIAKLDLSAYGSRAADILSQIRKTRSAVAAARAKSSVAGGYRLASVRPSAGTFSVPQFAYQFGYVLDDLTKRGGQLATPFNPFTSTETGADSFTTTTLTITEVFKGEGSHVTGTVRWSYVTVTTDTKSGATLVHVSDDRELVGGINVCPDANGGVVATIKVDAKVTTGAGSATTTRTSSGNSEFKGEVNDQAALTHVRQVTKTDTSWTAASGDGGYSNETSATWTPSSTGFLGGLDVGSIRATVTPRGTASAEAAAKAAGWDTVLDAYALDQAFLKAQDLWRHGRCVMIVAPEYRAETPIEIFEQEKAQHDEAVDVGSETQFALSLKHRFAGSLSQPIVASLTNGQKTIEPARLDAAGSLRYKAPDEDGKSATVKTQTTSRRGIGTLVLDFHTGGSLTLTITGTVTGNQGFGMGFGDRSVTDRVTMGPFVFKKGPLDAFVAMGTWTSEIHHETNYGPYANVCDGRETGQAQLVARMEMRGADKVWVIDPKNSVAATGPGSMVCVTTAPGTSTRTTEQTDGASGGLFLSALGEIVVPKDGGTFSVRGQSSFGGQWTAQGTVDAKTR